MATQEEMSRYFWSASTNCPPVYSEYLFKPILVPRASQPRASSLGPGTHGTGSARKLWDALAPVTIFTEKYYEETNYLCRHVDRVILPSENCSSSASSFLRSQSDLSLQSSNPEPNFLRVTERKWLWKTV